MRKIYFVIFLLIIIFNASAQKDTCIKKIIISDIIISGNKKTKDFIIKRELTFKKGDKICLKIFEKKKKQSKTNLLKTPLFNEVLINTEKESTNVIVKIKVVERWYIWPDVRLNYADRNFSVWLKNRDFSRTDFGGGLMKYNFRGRNERLYVYAVFGYNQTLSLSYSDLYFDKKRQHSLNFNIEYLTRKETVYNIIDDQTIQLKLNDNNVLKSIKTSLGYKIRKKIHATHDIYFGYENRKVHDTINTLNHDYFTDNQKYAEFFYLRYLFQIDKKNKRVFPTKGYRFSLTVNKLGLGILQKGSVNFVYIKPEFSKYTSISKRFSIANNIAGKLSLGKQQPFFLESALGLDFNIRGFEYYQINGTELFLLNNSLNFELLPRKTLNLKIIPLTQFNKIPISIYLSLNADFAYVVNKNTTYSATNKYVNTPLFSTGISANFVTYYDRLIRLEYTLTNFLQHGFFIHFSAPF